MAETKVLETRTSVSVIGDVISIRAYYDTSEVSSDTIEAFISESVQVREGVPLIEGELAIIYENDVDYEIDDDGNLIVNDTDASQYSIDSAGDLIYSDV